MLSSWSITRFFEKFTKTNIKLFQKVFNELFIWKLNIEKPKIIELFIDTMVMENNSSQKREGIGWTYKKTNGYQPFNIIWNNLLVDTVLKEGNKHSLSEGTAREKIFKTINLIRNQYSKDVKIIVKMDGGFLDEKLLNTLDNMNVYFITVEHWRYSTKKLVEEMIEKAEFSYYKNQKNSYKYTDFGFRCKSWSKFFTGIYVELETKEKQYILNFVRDKTLLITNIKNIENDNELNKIFSVEGIIKLNHSRGKSELTHRGIKNFGTEQLPFLNFIKNKAFYYIMTIGFFLFECFKKDVLKDIIPINSYADTIRRKVIDIAGKIIKTSRKISVKISEAAYAFLNPENLLKNIKNTIPLLN